MVLIDVLPRPPKPKGLDPSIIWRPQPRHNIPGSIWLPNVGQGALTDEMARILQRDFGRELSESDKLERPMVFYCQANCWMSWNAAKRAIALGYQKGPSGIQKEPTAGGRQISPTEYSEPLPSPEEP